jgi:isoleucyl-tRNA synthetase
MKFKSGTRRRALEYEKALVDYWKKNKTFEKSIEQRPADNSFVFYDGPPFITGVPHHGTLLSSIVKDAVPRYQTMKGKHVERVWGWDTHGLPAENFVEKKLGISDRHDIGTKVSLEEYINTARESMIQTGNLWESTVDRIGRWVDFQGAYKTMDKDYMESVWWAFKTLYEKGKIYEGEKVLMYDTKWATPLSKAEVTMDAGAYQVVTDPSVYVKFKLSESSVKKLGETGDVYLLAWTTTPWTLPANTALAVNTELDEYQLVEYQGEKLIIGRPTSQIITKGDGIEPDFFTSSKKINPKNLIGLGYEPLLGTNRGDNAHKIWHADYVTNDSGTGIVHLAPAYGEEDFELAKQNKIPVVHVLDEYGTYTEGDWKGENVWEINKTIAKTLKERGVVWKIDYIQHEYPHNLRNGNRLMYRAHPSWFMDIDGQRTEMLEENTEHVNWFPAHIKHGRFEKTVQQAPDWNLSRDRFWATAMPVWEGRDGDGKKHQIVVGSYAELKELSGAELDDYHRPWVDDIEFDKDGVHYKRIDKVLDCWFESGSMPFAQFHYPFENKEKFEQNFPGDFIVEYVGQVRAWFYYVHAVNVGLFGHNAFKNVIVTGNLMGNDGFKLSKSRGNFTDPNELMDKFSADSLRFLLLGSPVMNAEDFTLLDKDVGDVARKLSMIWNMYDFFTMYAEVDGWEASSEVVDPSQQLQNPLDVWIVSRLHQLIQELEKHMDVYDIPSALKPVLPFIDDASNWYVRRSRRRFWKSDDDQDKNDAYQTLYYVLVQLSKALAPFTPFLAEELYQKLTNEESVHLIDWPHSGHVNELIVDRMAKVREVINQGLSQRAKERLKVRQPLAAVNVYGLPSIEESMSEIIAEELNVKKVTLVPQSKERGDETFVQYLKDNALSWNSDDVLAVLDTELTDELRREGMAREMIRHVQSARKEAGLNVDDHIRLSIKSSNEQLTKALSEHNTLIASETLADSLVMDDLAYTTTVILEGADVAISLEKV